MQMLKLSEDQLRNISESIVMQRAENYVGKFHDCKIDSSRLTGKIRGNHGVYDVSLSVASDPLEFTCGCRKADEKGEFCKHAAALGLTYIYTPWVFTSAKKLERKAISTLDQLQFYVRSTPLKTIVDEMKASGVGTARLAEMAGISIQQLSAIIRDGEAGKAHMLTDPLKLAALYLIEKKFSE